MSGILGSLGSAGSIEKRQRGGENGLGRFIVRVTIPR